MSKVIFMWGRISRNNGMLLFRHRVLDGCRWIISVLHFFLYHYNWTRYVHTGPSTCLYRSSLLYIDSSVRHPNSQYIFSEHYLQFLLFLLVVLLPSKLCIKCHSLRHRHWERLIIFGWCLGDCWFLDWVSCRHHWGVVHKCSNRTIWRFRCVIDIK